MGEKQSEEFLERVPVSEVDKRYETQRILLVKKGPFEKEKERTLVKTLYEAFMDDFWHEMLTQYSASIGHNLHAPESIAVDYGDPNTLDGKLFMTYVLGIGLNKLENPKNQLYNLNGHDVRFGSLITFYSGLFDQILEEEEFIHGDRALRHLLFYTDKGERGLSVIDFENSRHATKEERKEESEQFQKTLFGRFGHSQARTMYDAGKQAVQGLGISDEVYAKTLDAYIKKMEAPGIVIDINKGTLQLP